jgi:dihydroorotate dehydrogenase
MVDLTVTLGSLKLKNPLICGSCELTMTEAGIRRCLEAGAAAVVAKSVNESPAAARQLAYADYVLLRPDWSVGSWESPSPEDSLFCLSGLAPAPLEEWLGMLARCDRYARTHAAYVVGSITVADPKAAADIAARMARAVRCIELNLGSPHGREAEAGAIRTVTEAEPVREYTRGVRRAADCFLIVKLGQGGDLVAMARAAVEAGADAVAMTGRFPGFMPDLETLGPVLGSWGVIGGPWALPISLYWVSKCRRALPRSVPIIGTNRARSGQDIIRFLLSGARAVEIASLLLMFGPGVIGRLIGEVRAYAERRGVASVEELVGVAADRARTYREVMAARPEEAAPWRRFVGEDRPGSAG